MPERAWYRIEEVCLLLALGRTKVYDEIKAGRLGVVRVGKARRVPHDELLAYVERAKRAAVPPSAGNGDVDAVERSAVERP